MIVKYEIDFEKLNLIFEYLPYDLRQYINKFHRDDKKMPEILIKVKHPLNLL